MAYNHREWDRGKDAWGEDAAWTGHDQGKREDDYSGDAKRRKFNGGGYQGYDSQTYEADPTVSYSQKSQNQSHGAATGSAAAGGFGKKRQASSEPSPHVIFLGLDPDFSEADLQAYLNSYGCTVETVTIIRERSSGASKGFGFAQFPSTEHARAFVEPSFPFIQVPPPASHGASATAAFYKALETGVPHTGRRVKIDYSQSASPQERGRITRGNTNDGTRDIGNSQHLVLLFRGLDPLSGPQAILQAMKSSSGPGKEGAKGMKRIILIKDRVTMASFGFAFVEFIDAASASIVLAATMSSQLHPSGFRISDRPVATSFANPSSFQPIADVMLRDDACMRSSIGLGGVEGTWVRYWDEASTIAVLEFEVKKPLQPEATSLKEKKEKKRKEAAIKLSTPIAPSTLPVSSKPVTLSFSKGPAKGTQLAPRALALGFGGASDDEEDEHSKAESSKAAASKRVAPLVSSKKTVSNINKWNQVQEELTTGVSHAAPLPLAATVATIVAPVQATVSTPTQESLLVEDEFEFSDVSAMSCLLCARQFKTLDQLKRHNNESELHKARLPLKNFKDVALRDIAREKALARKNANQGDQPRYRDRASERRTLFNQPDMPLPDKDASSVNRTSYTKVEAPPRPPTPPPILNPGQDSNNVGNKLLKMMGWTEGTGLGTAGDGRVDPIKTAIYADGAGLGASKGKDIDKYADGYSGYVSMAQDSARDRYGTS